MLLVRIYYNVSTGLALKSCIRTNKLIYCWVIIENQKFFVVKIELLPVLFNSFFNLNQFSQSHKLIYLYIYT